MRREVGLMAMYLNRRVLRVAAYPALMAEPYPRFRLEQGGHEAVTLTIPTTESGRGI